MNATYHGTSCCENHHVIEHYFWARRQPTKRVVVYSGDATGHLLVVDKTTQEIILSIDFNALGRVAYAKRCCIVCFEHHVHVFSATSVRVWRRLAKRLNQRMFLQHQPPDYYAVV